MMLQKAILSINPNAEFTTRDDEIEWLNGTTPISKSEIEAKIIELQTEYNSKQYQRDRASAYPSIQEQLDLQYWDKVNGTNKWQEAINAVKTKYPK